MAKRKNRVYTLSQKIRIIELQKKGYTEQEIADDIGGTRAFVTDYTSRYWKQKMKNK